MRPGGRVLRRAPAIPTRSGSGLCLQLLTNTNRVASAALFAATVACSSIPVSDEPAKDIQGRGRLCARATGLPIDGVNRQRRSQVEGQALERPVDRLRDAIGEHREDRAAAAKVPHQVARGGDGDAAANVRRPAADPAPDQVLGYAEIMIEQLLESDVAATKERVSSTTVDAGLELDPALYHQVGIGIRSLHEREVRLSSQEQAVRVLVGSKVANIHNQSWMGRPKPTKTRAEKIFRLERVEQNSQPSGQGLPARRGDRIVEYAHGVPEGDQERGSRLVQDDPSPRPFEERHAEVRLQQSNHPAQRRRAHVERAGRRREVLGLSATARKAGSQLQSLASRRVLSILSPSNALPPTERSLTILERILRKIASIDTTRLRVCLLKRLRVCGAVRTNDEHMKRLFGIFRIVAGAGSHAMHSGHDMVYVQARASTAQRDRRAVEQRLTQAEM